MRKRVAIQWETLKRCGDGVAAPLGASFGEHNACVFAPLHEEPWTQKDVRAPKLVATSAAFGVGKGFQGARLTVVHFRPTRVQRKKDTRMSFHTALA